MAARIVSAQEQPTDVAQISPELRERCLSVLRAGLVSEEFWPAMHAAEALTLAGQRAEVLAAIARRQSADDQQACGLAREAVRAGDRGKLSVLFAILDKPASNGHTHAAESLFKMAEVGDGLKLRQALSQDTDVRLKLMAAAALARAGHPTALDAVRPHVTNPDRELRKVAIWVLGQLGADSDRAAISAAWKAEQEPLARAYGLHALACLGDSNARAALAENLVATEGPIRTYAAEFAGYCRAVEHRPALVRLLDDDVLDVRVRAAQSLLLLSLPRHVLGLPREVAREEVQVDVYPATSANPRYSEGSVAMLRDGSLLYATTEFIGGGADHATARIIARTSPDGGRVWLPPRVLQENTGKQNVMSATLRRLQPGAWDGPLALFYLVKNGPTDLKVWLRVSHDEGQTFGDAVLVTNAAGYHVMNNDRVTVLTGRAGKPELHGRLICPVAWTDDVFKPGGGHFVCFCYLSDDGGRTWRKSTDMVDQPKRGAMEPEVIELANGELLMIVRTQLGKIATSRSQDGGNHWSAPSELSVQAPESPATIRRIPATDDLLLVFNNAYQPGAGHGGPRTPLTAAISRDEGRSWEQLRNIESRADQGFAYTSVLFARDRLILSYYVSDPRGGQISSRFRALPVAWLYGDR